MTDTQHIHLISDSTGETVNAVFRAALARFSDASPEVHVTVFVRSRDKLDAALDLVHQHRGLVVYTLADADLRKTLIETCNALGVMAVPVLETVIEALSTVLDRPPAEEAGMQHRITSEYFDRISALDFAISHDDGALGDRLMQADVILTGVSRTSKTPTCIYLAYRGIKAANVPLVPNAQPHKDFIDAIEKKIPVIGLTASPTRLSQVRQNRLHSIGSTQTADYAEIDQIRGEVANARLFFDRHDIPVIDVTRRSIEETAAEILAALRARGISLP